MGLLKLVLTHAKEVYGGSGVIAVLILRLGNKGGLVVIFTHRLHYPRYKPLDNH